ncbi:YhjD/YihY/BrkB family envelope integrity protein [Bacillus gobiensis]|uniref:YihY/virulence factor BrkB family protein n=1 Tax=Bacillus gobiensis TaxID=1441095 RepID=UPI003D221A37
MDFIKELISRFIQHEGPSKAAELSYYFLLSLFPFMIFLLSFTAYLPLSPQDVLGVIKQYAPGEVSSMLESNVTETLDNRNGGLLSFGILAALWSASNGLEAIVRSFNVAYEVEENRTFIVVRLTSIILTVAMVFTIIIALLLPVFGREIGMFVSDFIGASSTFITVWEALRYIISITILLVIFSALYFFAPNKRLHFAYVFPGAIIATVGWIVVSTLFSYYVSSFSNYSATYGSIGGIIVLMTWLYLSGIMILIGGEINALIYKRKIQAS